MSRKESILAFVLNLRKEIIEAFETLEKTAPFERKSWEHPGKGGGEMAILRGSVFEKAAVNFSAVEGDHFPMQDGSGPYFATGISMITHMQNPHMPTVHMNIRYIQTEKKQWFGGGYDLTPMGITYPEDTEHFHGAARQALDPIDETLYPAFKQAAAEYFYIPHRKKERGVGGIFFDHLDASDDNNEAIWKAVGNSFLTAILPIYQKRVHTPYQESDKEEQQKLRAHYAEFNLAYDRGTRFGFLSGGNTEAILCSMPPCAKW